LAKALGEEEIVDLLSATLGEEKQTDLKLTKVTEQHIMPAAMREGEEESSDRPDLSRTRTKAKLGA
jgi:ferritin-like metal-binding protein YciE